MAGSNGRPQNYPRSRPSFLATRNGRFPPIAVFRQCDLAEPVFAFGTGIRRLFDIASRLLCNPSALLGGSRLQKFLHDPRVFAPAGVAFEQQMVGTLNGDEPRARDPCG